MTYLLPIARHCQSRSFHQCIHIINNRVDIQYQACTTTFSLRWASSQIYKVGRSPNQVGNESYRSSIFIEISSFGNRTCFACWKGSNQLRFLLVGVNQDLLRRIYHTGQRAYPSNPSLHHNRTSSRGRSVGSASGACWLGVSRAKFPKPPAGAIEMEIAAPIVRIIVPYEELISRPVIILILWEHF